MTQTGEPSWQTKLPALAAFRRAQALTALERAVAVRPNLDAHALLAQLYFETGQLDRTLDQLRAPVCELPSKKPARPRWNDKPGCEPTSRRWKRWFIGLSKFMRAISPARPIPRR